MTTFAEQVAAALLEEADTIAARWRAQSHPASPRPTSRRTDASPAECVPAMVYAVACAVRQAPRCQDGVLRAGWQFGAAAHFAGAALHEVVKELDLLASLALYVVERAAVERAAHAEVGAAEGVRVTRRLHRAFAALRLAASKGYAHAAGDALRGRYRSLRHDLRNPLGTIRSAVALMDDESLPPEVRYSARYRAMVMRNTYSLDDLIGSGLSDAATDLATLALQEVALGDVALAVRRDMREEAEAASCAIEVAPALASPPLPLVRTDVGTFELALRSVLSVALARARPASTLGVTLRAQREDAVVVAVTSEPADADETPSARDDSLAFPETLTRRAGGRVWREGVGTVLLEIPIVPGTEADVEVARPSYDGAGESGVTAVAAAADRLREREIGTAAQPSADELPGGGAVPSEAKEARPERSEGAPPLALRSPRHAGDDLARATQGDHR